MAEAVFSDYGQGGYHTGEWHAGFTGHGVRPGAKYGKIGIGGFGALGKDYIQAPDIDSIANGIPEAYGDLVDGKQWGNDTVSGTSGRIEELRTFAVSKLGFKSGKVLIGAASHGALCALNYAHANPTKVQALGLAIPALNPQDIHDNSRAAALGATQTQMESVYGGSSSAFNTAMTTHNPMNYAEDFQGLPILLGYSSNDPICLPAYALDFASRSGATLVNLGAQGHAVGTDPVIAAQFTAFYAAHA